MKRIILVILISAFYITAFAQTSDQQGNLTQPDDQNMFSDMKIYPNPCKLDKITIESFNKKITAISITNIAGKQVYLKKFPLAENKKQVELSDVSNGIYLVKIMTNDDKQEVKKLIVSRE